MFIYLGLIQVFPSPYEQSSYAVDVSESSIIVPSSLYLVPQNKVRKNHSMELPKHQQSSQKFPKLSLIHI